MGKKNILWINYIKAISIIGVFIVHSQLAYGYWNQSLNNLIHPFYVNAFFFVSGYLLFRKQLAESRINQNRRIWFLGEGKVFFKNIFYRLIIPTILFSIIEFFPSHLLRGLTFDTGVFLYKTFGGGTYWFTAALVVAEILIFVMLLSRKKSIWFYLGVGVILYLIGHSLVSEEYSLFDAYPAFPWMYKHGLYAIVFLVIGGVYWYIEEKINKYMTKTLLIILIGVYVISLLAFPSFFHVLVSKLDINVPGILLSVLATVILIELCKLLPSMRLLNYIGQNTIGFYFMSGALPIVLSIFVHKFIQGCNIFGCMVVFIGSMLLACTAVLVINRWLPWMLDLRKLRSKNKIV